MISDYRQLEKETVSVSSPAPTMEVTARSVVGRAHNIYWISLGANVAVDAISFRFSVLFSSSSFVIRAFHIKIDPLTV